VHDLYFEAARIKRSLQARYIVIAIVNYLICPYYFQRAALPSVRGAAPAPVLHALLEISARLRLFRLDVNL
jgi:hypothetical protein